MSMEAGAHPGTVAFVLNGTCVRAECGDPQITLLDYLRSRGLTGAKEGCAEGECGACTIVEVTEHGGHTAYRPLNSCLLFLPAVAGREIYTVEALAAGGELHAVQRAMAAAGGSQCGYCTPGFVMSLFAEYYRPGRTAACDPAALEGNLCRCTGYRPIRDAALSLELAADDRFGRWLERPAPLLGATALETAAGRFSRPANLQDCLALLREDPTARPLAGATDLAVESNLTGRRFPHLVSLEALAELRVFEDRPAEIEIGAGLAIEEIRARWKHAPAALEEWSRLFASPLIRNRATLGGNLATASPIGDAAPLLLALDAGVKIAGPEGVRIVPLDRFFLGYRRTALQPGEILVSIIVPKPYPETLRFFKVAKRKADDISTVAAAFALNFDSTGRVTRARFGYGGVAAVPLRATEADAAVLGRNWNRAAVERAQAAIRRTIEPITDHRGSAEYRLAMAQSLLAKFQFEGAEGRAA